ncbi:hypothetical protein Hanom_Chr08g00740541 [Helianthus anomalus]
MWIAEIWQDHRPGNIQCLTQLSPQTPPTKPTSTIINFSSFKVAHNVFVELSKRVGLVHFVQILCPFSSLYIIKIPHFKNIVTIVCYGGFMIQFSVAI